MGVRELSRHIKGLGLEGKESAGMNGGSQDGSLEQAPVPKDDPASIESLLKLVDKVAAMAFGKLNLTQEAFAGILRGRQLIPPERAPLSLEAYAARMRAGDGQGLVSALVSRAGHDDRQAASLVIEIGNELKAVRSKLNAVKVAM